MASVYFILNEILIIYKSRLPQLIMIAMIILQNLHPHPPLRGFPSSHQLKLCNSLLGQNFQAVHYDPGLLRLFSD